MFNSIELKREGELKSDIVARDSQEGERWPVRKELAPKCNGGAVTALKIECSFCEQPLSFLSMRPRRRAPAGDPPKLPTSTTDHPQSQSSLGHRRSAAPQIPKSDQA
jgi:hypothetical protein